MDGTNKCKGTERLFKSKITTSNKSKENNAKMQVNSKRTTAQRPSGLSKERKVPSWGAGLANGYEYRTMNGL
ncbi:hypothetical protein NXS19_014046 [Fusarium pseudograminearum]|nr:hypothetical protein NXS19_014046 [Fusarium pseudograminearum]